MAKSAYVNARIDQDLKVKAESVFAAIGVSASQALTMFYRQVVYRRGIPFDVCIPNATTVSALEEAAAGRGQTFEGDTASIFDEIGAEEDNRGE